jgi:hypothetical protein
MMLFRGSARSSDSVHDIQTDERHTRSIMPTAAVGSRDQSIEPIRSGCQMDASVAVRYESRYRGA